MAAELGPFDRFSDNREAMLRVIRNHRRAAHTAAPEEYEGLSVRPVPIDVAHAPPELLETRAAGLGSRGGARGGARLRNAQVSVLAPTGTIGLVMDCDTTGVEPDFALVKFKKLAGGGYFKIINQSCLQPCGRWGTPSPRSSAWSGTPRAMARWSVLR